MLAYAGETSLASLGLGAPPASATTADGSVCGEEWPNSRDGNLRVWQDWGCQGILLGETPGNDRFWGDSANEGVFNSPDHLAPSSVMRPSANRCVPSVSGVMGTGSEPSSWRYRR